MRNHHMKKFLWHTIFVFFFENLSSYVGILDRQVHKFKTNEVVGLASLAALEPLYQCLTFCMKMTHKYSVGREILAALS